MKLERKALKKWSIITVVCAAHSFFWGATGANGNLVAMLLGVITLILMFASIESSAAYQARRAAKPKMARALDWSVKFRMWLAGFIILTPLVPMMFRGANIIEYMPGFFTVLAWPFMGEMFIGAGALSLVGAVTGSDLMAGFGGHVGGDTSQLSLRANFVTTYLTTIVTGLMHTIILAIIILVTYGVIRLRTKRVVVVE